MERFLQYMISGLSVGSLYALVALGLALIYRSTRILNFSHGDIATAGTYFAITLLGLKMGFWPSFILSLLFGGGLGMAFYFGILIPAQRREATLIGQIILTQRQGLDLVVHDAFTGLQRPVWSLSGGETFQASLALALGLADVVQSRAGGVRLEALFVDEGFGSLDAGALDLAVSQLYRLQGRGRIVGVISHVEGLRDRLPCGIQVEKRANGSRAVQHLPGSFSPQ